MKTNRLAGFCKGWRSDRVMLKLSKRFTFYDVWLWGLAGTSHSKPSLWSSPLTLMHWREFNELNFFSSLPVQGLPHWCLQLITSTADFIRHFPHMSAVGATSSTRDHCCWGRRDRRMWRWGNGKRTEATRNRAALAA